VRPYNFHVELDALREQIHQEHSLNVKYLQPTYNNIRSIQIVLDGFLSKTIKDKDRKREIRLAILSLWIERKVDTAYDLTVYQCSTISHFLERGEDGSLGARTEKFLTDSQAAAQGESVSGEDEFQGLDNTGIFAPVRLSEIP
jgi:hypothetical protein